MRGLVEIGLLTLCVTLLGCEVGATSGQREANGSKDQAAVGCAPCQFIGNEGLCLNRKLPPVATALADKTQAAALEAGASACSNPDEVCVPCINPLTGENTQACELSPAVCDGGVPSCENPIEIIEPSALPACEVGGRCVARKMIDAQSPGTSAKLPACSGVADGVCVPETVVQYGGNRAPTACMVGGSAGLEGRCLPEFVIPPEQRARLATLPDDPVCSGEGQRCLPCFDPLNGEDTGACTSGPCDAPVSEQAGFATCAGSRGRCIPTTIVAAQGQDSKNLQQLDCATGNVCVPNRLAAQPPVYKTCTTNLGGTGSCLDVTVLKVPLSGAFTQDICPVSDKCVPCKTLGIATGAPGCPK